MNKNILKHALLHAIGTVVYIALVATFMGYAETLFAADQHTVLGPIVFLSLLVFSVAVVGSLVFGKPILWYLDGKRREAVSLLFATLGVFLLIILGAILFAVPK